MEQNTILDRLGSDLMFPIAGSFQTVSGVECLIQDIQQLLLTTPGERVFRPTFGCGLNSMVWENFNDVVAKGPNAIKQAIQLFEPRITLTNVSVQSNENTGLIIFGIQFFIKNTDTQLNLVFPYRVGTALSQA